MQYRVTEATPLRQEPDRSARVLAELPAGTIVERTGKKVRRWLPVVGAGASGWIPDRRVERIGDAGPAASGQSEPVSGSSIVQIIRDAARRFGQPEEDLLRVARCESNLDPRAVNQAGPYFGLFQFLRSTWASTPFAGEDIFDPVANASAAAWMWQQGRRNEWVCQ
jgi:hypothetical protein